MITAISASPGLGPLKLVSIPAGTVEHEVWESAKSLMHMEAELRIPTTVEPQDLEAVNKELFPQGGFSNEDSELVPGSVASKIVSAIEDIAFPLLMKEEQLTEILNDETIGLIKDIGLSLYQNLRYLDKEGRQKALSCSSLSSIVERLDLLNQIKPEKLAEHGIPNWSPEPLINALIKYASLVMAKAWARINQVQETRLEAALHAAESNL